MVPDEESDLEEILGIFKGSEDSEVSEVLRCLRSLFHKQDNQLSCP